MSVELEDRGKALENEYFHRKEQELIGKLKAKTQSADTKTSGLKCPKCDGNLVETNYENIKIDVCDTCSGVWLDAGELAQVVYQDKDEGWFGRIFG